jgi:hypothetical protein
MERVYMVPEKEYSLQTMQDSKTPILSLPSSHSPIASLQAALQDLNTQHHLNDEARWRAYEDLFKSYFAFSRRRPIFNTALADLPGETDIERGGGVEWMNSLKSLFADPDAIERLIPPIIQTLPVTLRQKGLQLLFFLANTSDALNGTYQISPTGHIILSGREIPDSNLHDLIHYTVRPKRNVPEPQGWTQFLTYLRQHNVPRELLAKHWTQQGKALKRLSIMSKDSKVRTRPSVRAQKRKPQASSSPPMIEVKRTRTQSDSDEDQFEDVSEHVHERLEDFDDQESRERLERQRLTPPRPRQEMQDRPRAQPRARTTPSFGMELRQLGARSRQAQQKGKGLYKRSLPRRWWSVIP